MYDGHAMSRVASRIESGAECLEGVSALLMAMQRHWDEADRESRLALTLEANREVWAEIQTALADGTLSLPVEVQQNLLILSVYASGRIDDCETSPAPEKLAALLALTRKLAYSLRDWKIAA